MQPTGEVWERAKCERNWGLFRLDKRKDKPGYDKRPVNPRSPRYTADTDKVFVLTFDEAMEWVAEGKMMLGYIPRPGSLLIGLDFDHVRHQVNGVWVWKPDCKWAYDAIRVSDTYWEASPSLDGVRVLMLRGKWPDRTMFGGGCEIIGGTEGGGSARGFTVTLLGEGQIGAGLDVLKRAAIQIEEHGGGKGGGDLRDKEDHLCLEEEREKFLGIIEDLPGESDGKAWIDVTYAIMGTFGAGDDEAYEAWRAWSMKTPDAFVDHENRERWARMERQWRRRPEWGSGWRTLENRFMKVIEPDMGFKRKKMKQAEILDLIEGTGKAEVTERRWRNLSEKDWASAGRMFAEHLPENLRPQLLEYLSKQWSENNVREG